MSMAMYVPDRADDEAELRLKIFRREASLSLSRIMPHLSLLGVDVIDERPYELAMGKDQRAFIYDFGYGCQVVPTPSVPAGHSRRGSGSWTPSRPPTSARVSPTVSTRW